jgi:hypothetical protein
LWWASLAPTVEGAIGPLPQLGTLGVVAGRVVYAAGGLLDGAPASSDGEQLLGGNLEP